jgi:hypothetical protein
MHTLLNSAVKVSSKYFDYDKETKEFSIDISMLHHSGADPFQRIFPGSAEKGFVMSSFKSGNFVAFIQVGEQRDPDGDLLFWTFEPTAQDKKDFPTLEGVRVRIFND